MPQELLVGGAYWYSKWLKGQVATSHSMERIICNHHGCPYLGINLAEEKSCSNAIIKQWKVWASGTTCRKEIMALVHFLYYFAAKYNIKVCIVHIAVAENDIADYLSRFHRERFKKLAPLANSAPDSIPVQQPSPSLGSLAVPLS